MSNVTTSSRRRATVSFPIDTDRLAAAFRRGMQDLEAASRTLVEQGWTIPMSLMPRDVYELLDGDAGQLDDRFVQLFDRNRRRLFRETATDILDRAAVSRWRSLLEEAALSYRADRYVITVPALIVVIEGIITSAEGRRTNPTKVLHKRMEAFGQPRLSITALLWRVAHDFVGRLFVDADFRDKRPALLNRHWILHGRDASNWTKADSLRLFLTVDLVSSLFESKRRLSE